MNKTFKIKNSKCLGKIDPSYIGSDELISWINRMKLMSIKEHADETMLRTSYYSSPCGTVAEMKMEFWAYWY